MATRKTLYEVLEVAQSASPETIDAAYRTLCARINARQTRDPEGTSIARTAVEEAYRTLSSENLRRHYDARLRLAAAPAAADVARDERTGWSRGIVALVTVVALAAGYGYYARVQKQQAEMARQLEEKEQLLARQQAESDEAQRRTAEAEEQRRRRLEELRYQAWLDQNRREAAAHARRQEHERVRTEQEAARERRMEEMAKQRDEAQARARLEQDKQRLRQLEQQNYGHRRY